MKKFEEHAPGQGGRGTGGPMQGDRRWGDGVAAAIPRTEVAAHPARRPPAPRQRPEPSARTATL